MTGVRHLVNCRCVLPQYKDTVPVVFHKFPVFSVIDDNDNVEVKLVKCDNCGSLHRVTDIFKSSILTGREDSGSTLEVEDIRSSLPTKIVDLLSSYNIHLSVWEEIQFNFQMSNFGFEIILTRENIDNVITGKKLKIIGPNEFIVSSFSSNSFIE